MRGAGLILLSVSAAAAQPVEYNRDVRPILADKCFVCHGPDAAAKGVPFRLDTEEQAKAERKGRRAIVAGQPEESELIKRVTHARAALRMPPAQAGPALSESDIGTLRRWIAEGGAYQKHWSLIRPQRPPLPVVRNAAWARNPIDAFVLARLEREGLQPAPPAAWETLLRRASLDLTGLPPTPADVDSFLKAPSEAAYEKFVDALLASPRYAERMAARWLDAARYADSNGYQFDGERQMWRWRDWVIGAFHANMPFDRFAVEQIAGDLLPGAERAQRIATGFNRNHRGNTEDGIIPEEYQVEYVVDRVETTATVFMGLTLGCTRCHNHKYDPFTQKEFYQLFAYFNNIPENGRAMKYGNSPPLEASPTEEQERAHRALLAKIEREEAFLARHEAEIAAQLAQWKGAGDWAPARGLERTIEPAALPLEASGAAAFDIEDRFTVAGWVRSGAVWNGALFTRMDDRERGRGYGVYAREGRIHVHFTTNYADDAIRLETEEAATPGAWRHVAVSYSGSRMAEGISVYLDGRPTRVKVETDTLYRPFVNAGNRFPHPFRLGAGGGPKNRFSGEMKGVRIWSRVLAEQEVTALAGQAPDYARRRQYLETDAPADIRDAWRRLEQLRWEEEQLTRTFPTVMVMREMSEPRQTHFLNRGEYNKRGERVEAGTPAALPRLPEGAPNNRLGLAQWLVSAEHPLTARVAVNRFWQMLFGMGLVKTTEDFGQQGEWPSHPELLDWLAVEFRESGWNVKHLMKRVATSNTYRQSSSAPAELVARDPENRLLARGPRFRLPAEMVRDEALFVAGLLKERVGGPSVKPYQPAGLWKEIAMQDMDYVQSKGDDLYRRSLYTFWKRTIPPPMMVTFDAAGREACTVRESRTNTPLQALNLMNDPTFVEAARFLGQRMLQEGGAESAARLAHGFRLATARAPKPAELAALQRSLAFHRDYFASDEARARQYLALGDAPPDPKLDKRELAAYAAVASLILNLDEVLTKE